MYCLMRLTNSRPLLSLLASVWGQAGVSRWNI